MKIEQLVFALFFLVVLRFPSRNVEDSTAETVVRRTEVYNNPYPLQATQTPTKAPTKGKHVATIAPATETTNGRPLHNAKSATPPPAPEVIDKSTKRSNETVTTTSPLSMDNIHIKVPYPVFVASLYKSGTTTIHAYFQCGGQKSVHYKSGRTRTGPCLQRRIQKGLHPVFQGCGGDTFDIYTDNANLNAPRSCFDPSVHGLDQIYESYPNGTILMAVRDSHRWLDSVERYKFPKWELLSHLQQCPDLWLTQKEDTGNRTTLTKDDILKFYDWHTAHVRKFAAAHPSMTYVEVKLEDPNTAQILQDRVGIPASCWGHSNINTRHTSSIAEKKETR